MTLHCYTGFHPDEEGSQTFYYMPGVAIRGEYVEGYPTVRVEEGQSPRVSIEDIHGKKYSVMPGSLKEIIDKCFTTKGKERLPVTEGTPVVVERPFNDNIVFYPGVEPISKGVVLYNPTSNAWVIGCENGEELPFDQSRYKITVDEEALKGST